MESTVTVKGLGLSAVVQPVPRAAHRLAARLRADRARGGHRGRLPADDLGVDGARHLVARRSGADPGAAAQPGSARPGDDRGDARVCRLVRGVGALVAIGSEHARRGDSLCRLRRHHHLRAADRRAAHGRPSRRRCGGGDRAPRALCARHACPARPVRLVRLGRRRLPALGPDHLLERARRLLLDGVAAGARLCRPRRAARHSRGRGRAAAAAGGGDVLHVQPGRLAGAPRGARRPRSCSTRDGCSWPSRPPSWGSSPQPPCCSAPAPTGS